MKALVQTDVETFELQDVPDPEPADGEVLVRVAACGVCGSDMHAFFGHDERRPVPIVLGHEAAGTVEDGTDDAGPDTGARVAINPLVACGTCENCLRARENLCVRREILSLPPRPGAFAEVVAVPGNNLVPIPDSVSFAHAALVEPLACGWHAVRLGRQALDRVLAGLPCVVIGGGAIGVGAALALREQGADDVTLIEPNTLRREMLRGSENFAVIEAENAAGHGEAALVIDAVGYAATREAACRLVRPGGVIAHIGLGYGEGGLDVRRMTLQEITFIGTYTYTAKDFRDAAAAIFEGRMGALDWIETRPLADGARAFDDIRNGRVAAAKVVLEP